MVVDYVRAVEDLGIDSTAGVRRSAAKLSGRCDTVLTRVLSIQFIQRLPTNMRAMYFPERTSRQGSGLFRSYD